MRRFGVVAGLAAAAAACLSGPSEFTDPAVTIRVKAGEEFAIVLDSNPSTGYAWRLASPVDEKIVRFVRSRYAAGDSGGRVGAGGKEYWTFTAASAGSTVIRLQYSRAADSSSGSIVAFSVDVR